MKDIKTFAALILLTLFSTVSYGQFTPEGKQDSTKAAMSYAAQAFDYLEVYERLLANQKAHTNTMQLAYEESELQTELLTTKVDIIQERTFWQKLWAWLKVAGLMAGSYLAGAVIGI